MAPSGGLDNIFRENREVVYGTFLSAYQEKFFDDLVTEIGNLTAMSIDEIGFLDKDIETGNSWSERLAQALRMSRVFIYLHAPLYFTRPWCGKEWHVFRSRVDAYVKDLGPGAARPPLMIPVLWTPPTGELPTVAADIQYKHRDFGEVYVKEGVFNLMRLSDNRDHYFRFLSKLAGCIIEAGNHNLPSCGELPSFDQVPNAFATASPSPVRVLGLANLLPQTAGPRHAQFVYVVGRRDELQAFRRVVDAYGEEGELDWKPYFPHTDDAVFVLANQAALKLRLKYEAVPLGDDLVQRLREAQEQRKIVVLIVDAWSLKIDRYYRLVSDYDKASFRNCVVVVPWNEDDETREQTAELQDFLEMAFENHPEVAQQARVTSSEQLLQQLDTLLNRCRASILRALETFRRVQGRGPWTRPVISAVKSS